MEGGGEDTKLETVVACEKFNLVGGERTDMSNLQARRRFMITDILNSSLEKREQESAGGLDMRLLFPRIPLNLSQDVDKQDTDTDNEEEADMDENKGNSPPSPSSVLDFFSKG